MYYKTTDSEGNEWATSRSNPTKIVNYAGEYSGHPKMRWTASKPKSIKTSCGFHAVSSSPLLAGGVLIMIFDVVKSPWTTPAACILATIVPIVCATQSVCVSMTVVIRSSR